MGKRVGASVPRAHMGAPRDHRGLLAALAGRSQLLACSHHLLWCFLGLCASFQKEKPEERKEKAGASWLGVRGLRGQTWGQSLPPHPRP